MSSLPVFICVYIKALLWLRSTSSHAAESLSATIEGSFLPFLTDLIVLLQEAQVGAEETPPLLQRAGPWPRHSCSQFAQWKWEKFRKVPSASSVSRDPERDHKSPGRKPSLQPAVQRPSCGRSAEGSRGKVKSLSCQVIASQSWFWHEGDRVTTAGTRERLSGLKALSHQTTGHPLSSEEARLLSNPSAQRSPLTMWTESPSAGQVHAKTLGVASLTQWSLLALLNWKETNCSTISVSAAPEVSFLPIKHSKLFIFKFSLHTLYVQDNLNWFCACSFCLI